MTGFRVMTFNIRYDTAEDGPHAWASRRSLVFRTIRDHDPDLLGVQEATSNQWSDLTAALSGWAHFGLADNGPLESESDVPGLFVRTARFDSRESGLFWLSDTPREPGSITWPNDCAARMCCWARLQDRQTGRTLLFACTHVDTNAAGWLPSARVLEGELDVVAAGAPIVLVGDFNSAAGSVAHRYLCGEGGYRDAWTEAGHTDERVVTFNGFSPGTRLPDEGADLQRWLERTSTPLDRFGHYVPHIRAHRNYRIDWILLRGAIRCVSAANDYRTDRGLLPSDHYPVVAVIAFDESGEANITR